MEAALRGCELCPRRCGVNRAAGERGRCRAGSALEIYRHAPHFGEEPPISGRRGSGTVFFSRCTLRCLYCQNFRWSQEGRGRRCGVDELASAFRELFAAGCHNWNLVSPTPWLPHIRAALDAVRRDGLALPVVYNTSGYERVATLAGAEEWVDVYLTDLRYARESSAREGSGADDYVRVAREALREMWRQKGPLRTNDDGIAVAGTICRLLILPGRADEAVESLAWLAETVGTGVAVSVMAQYVPAYRAAARGEPWHRRITRAEYERVRAAMDELGFECGWTQDFDGEADEELLGFKMAPQAAAGVAAGDHEF
jgi:putative pyruvate formate lyase activating enzyme